MRSPAGTPVREGDARLNGSYGSVNRIALLGSLIASLGLFFLPLIELKPNRIAPGLQFQLLQLEGDLRYLVLFALTLFPVPAALTDRVRRRGWLLVGIGNAVLLLTLILPVQAGGALLADAGNVFGDNVIVNAPRLLPSAALALSLLGGYVVLFGGLRDLAASGAPRGAQLMAAWGGVALIALLAATGQLNDYSVMVEFHARGEQLGRKLLEHSLLVMVSLSIGTVLGAGLGLWAARDERISPVIMYTVGTVQTIPSLALFGILLAPLARLGDRQAVDVALLTLGAVAVAALGILLYRAAAPRVSGRTRQALLVAVALASAVPLALIVVSVSSFLFRVSFVALTGESGLLEVMRTTAAWLTALTGALWLTRGQRRRGPATRTVRGRLLRAARFVAAGLLLVNLLLLLSVGAAHYLAPASLGALSMRDLGVSGIGVAPGVIALTLYSLLPLVRNTHAGLKSVDPAVIDSGRGMGMTPWQRFHKIELPVALPVIMAGVRNAAVALVGIAAVASIIGAGGLGDFIFIGINNTSIDQILLGAVPAVLLAVLLDAALRGVERLLVSPGIREAAHEGGGA